jgi:predicted Na+-dependent transporter
MSISIKRLRSEARGKVVQGVAILFASSLIGIFSMPLGILVMLIGFVGATIYIYSSIGNIQCPTCKKPFGVGMNFIGSIEVPNRCICCHEQAS